MKTINITIEGTTPLMLQRFTDEAQMSATNGTRASAVGDSAGSPLEQAESRLYKDEYDQPVIPGPNLFACIIAGGKFFKSGKSKVTTMKSSLIPACATISEIVIPIESTGGWQVDTRPVRIPSTGGRILRHRPMFQDWRLSFSVEIDESVMGVRLFREIVDAAGSRVGLGEFRPDCKGPFGKFVIVSWAEAD